MKFLKKSNILKPRFVVRLLCVKRVSFEAAHNLYWAFRKQARIPYHLTLVYIQKFASFRSTLGNRSDNNFLMSLCIRTVMFRISHVFIRQICSLWSSRPNYYSYVICYVVERKSLVIAKLFYSQASGFYCFASFRTDW